MANFVKGTLRFLLPDELWGGKRNMYPPTHNPTHTHPHTPPAQFFPSADKPRHIERSSNAHALETTAIPHMQDGTMTNRAAAPG